MVAINSGLPKTAPAFSVSRLCGSGLQAILSPAQNILLGDVAVGGGAEAMSRDPTISTSKRMGDAQSVDYMLAGPHGPSQNVHMGITAENVASRWSISHEEQDALAAKSHRCATVAIAEGRFRDQIVPVEIVSRKGSRIFDVDEHLRADTTLDALSKMRPAFQPGVTVVPTCNGTSTR